MEYKLLETKGPGKRLDTMVNEAIEQGWRPQGGVVVWVDDYTGTMYAQAMVKD